MPTNPPDAPERDPASGDDPVLYVVLRRRRSMGAMWHHAATYENPQLCESWIDVAPDYYQYRVACYVPIAVTDA